MPEHLIRLRGPWDLIVADESSREAVRIDLPTDRLPQCDHPVRLRRRFGRPARLAPDVPCSIRADDVPGLLAMALNGETLAEHPPLGPGGADSIDIPVGSRLQPRNLLELTVAPRPVRGGGDGRPWGAIALVFGSDSPPPVDGTSGPTR